MKTRCLVMFAAALLGQAAMTIAGEDEMTASLVPGEGGVAACMSVTFGDLSELPEKAVKGLGSLMVCITQPVHPYHYVRDEQGRIVKDGDGDNKKVWFPFYRVRGTYQHDSVVGIVYDNRGTNGIAGSRWFAGYGNSGWQDKGGKIMGLALLAWGTSEALESKNRNHEDSSREIEPDSVVSTIHSREEPTAALPKLQPPVPQPQPEPTPPPILPDERDGNGGPVGS